MRINTTHRIAVTALLALSVTACSTVDDLMNSEQVDYKSTVRGNPLTLPPDLASTQLSPQYSTYAGSASAVAYNKAVDKAAKERAATGGVLPVGDGMQVMRSGDRRWLQVDRDASKVYKDVLGFWASEGFTINRENPQSGLIETDWAENRAKIPGDFLRRTLGSIIDMVADSGERDRFTTRLERVNGKTEVYIRHERLVETQMDKDGTTFKWLPAPEDQELNAVMLSRLMAYMGMPKEQAQEAVKSAHAEAAAQTKASFINGQAALAVVGSREDVYRDVGYALSGAGFTMDSSDSAAGNYVVRYLDTDTGEKRKESNIFSRLFGDNGNITPVPYTINVASGGGQSVVTVRDSNGNVDNSETALRILSVIRERL
ncbi:outer membrane protein assembly factor BamC [Pelistega europaea]|uniref:Outer membrane protein assembly factor BamC n=1 Tax=Pelistega europaea TaxID=106147 RepID=A0A7Y4LAT2_9BURK|nr:outer membrane protein assembly factor BamC [Pelistega europaea]NOL50170.1 outer membrane protein assembly factor BamC [Pelistega europaea]